MKDLNDWAQNFYTAPDWQVSLEDYMGPFPVGGVQYRPEEVMALKKQFVSIREHVLNKGVPDLVDMTPDRDADLRILGLPDEGLALAFSTRTGDLVSTITPLGLFRDPGSDMRGVGAQIYRALSGQGSKKPAILDYSIAGFYARRNAHALIVSDAISAGHEVPQEVLKDYEITNGRARLTRDYTPESHNAHWGVAPKGDNAHLLGKDWYDLRGHLRADMTFRTTSGDVVMLIRRVEGDGTQWEVSDWSRGGWCHEGSTIEPGELYERITDPEKDAKPSPASSFEM